MKAAALSSRPDFRLMKQTDIQSFYHLQMPRWLFFDKKYSFLSLEAKVAYTFLLNRFQLSKLNNWINPAGEVFIIYTRESLAEEIQISYRRVISCMKELAAARLIWEKRCGRGDANQIYLAKVELTDETACIYNSPPFVDADDEAAGSRPAETACLECDGEDTTSLPHREIEETDRAADIKQDLQNPHNKTCENGRSRSAVAAYQDLQNPHKNNIDFKNIDKSDIDSQSVSPTRTRDKPAFDGPTDEDTVNLDKIIERCCLWTFSPETAKVFENAIERLYFSQTYRIGNAVLPQKKVRSHLWELDDLKLREAEHKLYANRGYEIKNTTAYTMAVIFNSIWESESDLMCDPYLNSLRNIPSKEEI